MLITRILTAPVVLNKFSRADLGRLVTHVKSIFTLNTFRFIGTYVFFTCKTFLLWTSMPQTFGTRLRVITVHQHSHHTLPASQEHSAWLLVHPNGKKEVKSCCHAESKEFTTKLAWIEERCLEGCNAVEELRGCVFTSKSYITRTSKRSSQRDSQLQSRDFRFCIIEQTGLLNSPKTKMINGIMLVVLPQAFLQVFLWRCNWLVVPGAAVRNDGRTPISFWGLGFGQLKAHTSATVSHKIQNLPPDGRKVIVENGPPHAEKLARSKMIVEAGDWLTGHEANAGKHIKEAAGNTAQFAWKQRASRMYDLPTLDWPCPTRIWCICCLSTAYQSSIRSSHIASLRGAALEVIGWPTAIHCSFRLLHLSNFVTRPQQVNPWHLQYAGTSDWLLSVWRVVLRGRHILHVREVVSIAFARSARVARAARVVCVARVARVSRTSRPKVCVCVWVLQWCCIKCFLVA